MTTQALSFKALVPMAIAAGAITPNPGYPGVWVWSTTAVAPLCWNGTSWQGAGTSVDSTVYSNPTLDFGSTPVKAKRFSIQVPGALAGMRVDIRPSGYTPAGVAFDEAEFESITYVGKCVVDGTLLVIANSSSAVKGQRIAQIAVRPQ